MQKICSRCIIFLHCFLWNVVNKMFIPNNQFKYSKWLQNHSQCIHILFLTLFNINTCSFFYRLVLKCINVIRVCSFFVFLNKSSTEQTCLRFHCNQAKKQHNWSQFYMSIKIYLWMHTINAFDYTFPKYFLKMILKKIMPKLI